MFSDQSDNSKKAGQLVVGVQFGSKKDEEGFVCIQVKTRLGLQGKGGTNPFDELRIAWWITA